MARELADRPAVTQPTSDATRLTYPQLEAPEDRVEGRGKVTGQALYTADLVEDGMLWAAYARSPIPHGRILAVDVSAARSMPGVHAVLTGADTRPTRLGRRLFDWPVLAWDRVRFIGDRVAVVAAETREGARAAAEQIRVEYEELEAAFTTADALADGGPILHEPDEASEYFFVGGTRPSHAHPNIQGHHRITRGVADIEAVFGSAHRVFDYTFTAPRQFQGYLEPHATLVRVEHGKVHVSSTNKTPFLLQRQMADSLGLPVEAVEVESRVIGGDFGGKGLSIDEYACYFLAAATGRPVKAVTDYSDEMQAANPRHSATVRLRTAVDADGRFIAHQSRVVFDGGAYAAGKPSQMLIPPGGLSTLGPYRVPNVDLEATAVYTNNVPAGHMRGPGETQALFASESHVDMIAAELGIDPLEFRLLNVVRDGEEGPTGVSYPTPRGVEVLETLRSATGWGSPIGPNRGRGIGFSVRRPGGGATAISMRLCADGTIDVTTGAPDQGGGTHTAIQRVTAVALSVAIQRVHVTLGTTNSAPIDAGIGGSRATYLSSRAVELAARSLKPRLETLAATILGVGPEAVELRDDRFTVTRDGIVTEADFETILGLAELPEVTEVFDSRAEEDPEAAASFIGYVVEVSVDPKTGEIAIADVTLVADVGTIINPTAHRGQVNGGFIFGLGGARTEELVVEEGKVVTVGLNDYKLSTSMDVPPFRTILLAAEPGSGAFGAKMVGELTNGVVAPALANAVAAAAGVRLHTFPLTAERVFEAMRGERVSDRPA
jgi:CO/xanthine dehydrogenase Mo-binding subunit